MTLTLSTQPQFPVANKPVTLTVTATHGNYFKLFATDAPPGSKIREAIDAKRTARELLIQGDTGKPQQYTFDVGGVYEFVGQEYTKGAAPFGGGYDGDPLGYRSETVLSETDLRVNVGTRLTTTIGIAPDTATLVVHVWGSTIRQTTIALHGEDSPAIIQPATDKARTAALITRSFPLALVNINASTAMGSLATLVDGLIDNINGHLNEPNVHGVDDTDNAIDVSFKNPGTMETLAESTRRVYQTLTRHMGNDSGNGIGSANYHTKDGVKLGDWASLPGKLRTGTLEEIRSTLADLWWSYTLHRQSADGGGVHRAADVTNIVTTPGAIVTLEKDFIAELKKLSPTAPATVNSGVTALVHGGGFKQG